MSNSISKRRESLNKEETKKESIKNYKLIINDSQSTVLTNKKINMDKMDKHTENEIWEYEKGMFLADVYSKLDCLTPSEIVKGLNQTIKSSRNSTFSYELKLELQNLLKEL